MNSVKAGFPMATRPRIQHVSIPRPPGSESADQARAFYGDLLGLEEKTIPGSIQHSDLVWFRVGDGELHVFADKSPNARTGQHFCMDVDDVDGLRQRLVDAGYTPTDTTPIRNRPRFFCRDPFGNQIEFTTVIGDYE
jgi:catechol 2,3-dioxygenase-like lactoylglutathione lyase family enzyme